MTSLESSDAIPTAPRWVHALALLTALAALPLLMLGADVTTKKVGMVDTAPVRWPWHLIPAVQEKGGWGQVLQFESGWLVEHMHRTLGWLVGMLAVTLAIALARYERRRWLRWMGLVALMGVSLQGILGILRVYLDQRIDPDVGSTLALIHGCTAQLVFALLVSVALWTSSTWESLGSAIESTRQPMRWSTSLLVGLLIAQMVCGALMRHKGLAAGARLHFLLSFAVVAAAVWVGVSAYTANASSVKLVWILWALLGIQLVLGFETFLIRFDVRWPYTGARVESSSGFPEFIPSMHYLIGALTFATATSLALIAHRHVVWHTPSQVAELRQLEGAQ